MPTQPSQWQGLSKAQMVQQLQQEQANQLARQQDAILEMKQSKDALATKPMPINFSALANFADGWTGSNISRLAQPTETPESRAAAIRQMEQAIAQQEGKISDDQRALLGQYMNADYNQQLMAQRDKHHKDDNDLGWAKLTEAKKIGGVNPSQLFGIRSKLVSTDEHKQATGINSFLSALNEYTDLVEKNGINPTGEGSAKMKSAYSKLTTAYKEAEKLGALSGPDMSILHNAIKNAGDWDTWFTAQLRGGTEGIQAAADQIRTNADNDFKRSYGTLRAMSEGFEEAGNPVLKSLSDNYVKARRIKMKETPADDAAALEWAKSNPTNPDAVEILKVNGLIP